MFKLLVFAALIAVAVAQFPFNGLRSPLGLDPYYGGLGNYYNGLGGDYYNRGLLGGDYYNRGLIGGDYYNRGLLGGRGIFNNYYGAYRGLPGLRRPVIPPVVRRPAVIPPIVRRPAVIPPIVRRPAAVVPPAVIPPVVRAPIAPIAAATAEGGARIVSQSNDATADGAYQYHYETENGIAAAEQNIPKVTQDGEVVNTVQGTYSYVAPTGEQITVSYVADENGFQPQLQDGSAPVARGAPVPRLPVRRRI